MRIALVTEEFLPSDVPSARVTREIVGCLVEGGHDVTVFAAGRGQANFRGARIFWASRMTTCSRGRLSPCTPPRRRPDAAAPTPRCSAHIPGG
jgi:hypothetical protein